jgi:hypothetical protein
MDSTHALAAIFHATINTITGSVVPGRTDRAGHLQLRYNNPASAKLT